MRKTPFILRCVAVCLCLEALGCGAAGPSHGGSGGQSSGGTASGGQPGAGGTVGGAGTAGSLGTSGSGTGGSAGSSAGTGGGVSAGGSDGAGGSDASGGSGANGSGGSSAGEAGSGGSGGGGPNNGDLVGVETPGASCTVPALAPFAQLPTNAKFPDPFTMLDGTPVTTRAQWICRHRELSAMFQRYETGQKTAKPGQVSGSMSGSTLTVSLSDGAGKNGSFTVSITYPSGGTGPYPAMVGLNGGSLNNNRLRELGVATINLQHNSQIRAEGNRSSGLFSSFTGQTDAGALIAWAWGVSRLIDALEVTPGANINPARVGITGCSRDGKGALMIGVMDSRIALTIPQESGSGGVAAWRASEYEDANRNTVGQGGQVQTLSNTYTEQAWFGTAIAEFNGNTNRLPVDHHELIALAAPRGLLALGNIGWQWLGRYNGVQGVGAARKVYQALGAAQNIGFVESGHQHCGTDYAGREQAAIDAFVRRFLLDQNVSTDFWDNAVSLEEARWVDWQTPNLQ
jgi:hypothetical protein